MTERNLDAGGKSPEIRARWREFWSYEIERDLTYSEVEALRESVGLTIMGINDPYEFTVGFKVVHGEEDDKAQILYLNRRNDERYQRIPGLALTLRSVEHYPGELDNTDITEWEEARQAIEQFVQGLDT